MLFILREYYITGILEIPYWPFVLSTGVFTSILAVVFIREFLEDLGNFIAERTKNWLLLLPGILSVLALFIMAFNPSLFFASKISPQAFGVVSLLVLFLLIFLGVYIGAAMATIAFWGLSILIAPHSGLAQLGIICQSIASSYTWSVIPMFMWMGVIVGISGLAQNLYTAAYKWIGHFRGGLASATAFACGGLAAATGDSMTGVVTISPMALPSMKRLGYDDKLATGTLCSASTVGWLIPPSIGFIVYGILTEQSIGQLFMAGIIPGVLMTLAFVVLITIRCRITPNLGPAGPHAPWRERWFSLRYGVPVAAIFLLVMGGIWTGIFTPTEAGAMGAFLALLTTLAFRMLNWKTLVSSLEEALRMVSLVFFIFIFANALTVLMAVTQLPFTLADFVEGLNVPPVAIIITIVGMYLILGSIMNALPALILTLPVLFPTVMAAGYDPIWFGVIMVIMLEVGQTTPPIGMNVFIMSGISGVPMYSIFRGVLPFWITQICIVGLLIAFPQIALFLPNQMYGG